MKHAKLTEWATRKQSVRIFYWFKTLLGIMLCTAAYRYTGPPAIDCLCLNQVKRPINISLAAAMATTVASEGFGDIVSHYLDKGIVLIIADLLSLITVSSCLVIKVPQINTIRENQSSKGKTPPPPTTIINTHSLDSLLSQYLRQASASLAYAWNCSAIPLWCPTIIPQAMIFYPTWSILCCCCRNMCSSTMSSNIRTCWASVHKSLPSSTWPLQRLSI